MGTSFTSNTDVAGIYSLTTRLAPDQTLALLALALVLGLVGFLLAEQTALGHLLARMGRARTRVPDAKAAQGSSTH